MRTAPDATMYSRVGGIYLNNNGAMRMDSLTLRNNFGKAGGAVTVLSTAAT
ncbi:MAG: hypothetical protein U0176_09900 [Bacteroidia bacterium]